MTTLAPQILSLYEQQTDYTIFGTSWIPNSARLLSVGMSPKGTGQVTIWGFEDNQLKRLQQNEKPSALKCASFNASLFPQRQFATGDHDGHLFEFDVENLSKPSFSVQAHQGMVECVDGFGGKDVHETGAPEIVSGGADGLVKLWDVRVKDPVMVLEPDDDSQVRIRVDEGRQLRIVPECWCCTLGGAVNVSDRYLCAGFDSGDLKLIDLRMMRVVYQHHFANGICSVDFDRQDTKLNKLYLGTLEGHFYTLDLLNLNDKLPIVDFKPFDDSATLWSVRANPYNRETALCTSGSRIGLVQYTYPRERSRNTDDGVVGVAGECALRAETTVTTETVQSLSWCREKEGLIAWGAMDETVNVGFVSGLKGCE